MSNAPRQTPFAIGCSIAVALLIAGLFICYCAALEQSRSARVPGPIVPIVARGQPRLATAPVVSIAPLAKKAAHVRRIRHSCGAECRAYRKAYANARRANALLGRHQYREHREQA
jgi:hypothetical protein